MAELTDIEIGAAVERGRIVASNEPRASAARYDQKSARVIVDLTNECTFVFPPRLVEGLEAAKDEELAQVEILGAGYGLHWETLDVDISVPGLLAGIFGSRAYMARLAEQGKPARKAAAAPANGAKRGGRRKSVRA